MRLSLQYVITLIVFCHGFSYVWTGSALPASSPAWKGTSWLLGDLVTGTPLQVFWSGHGRLD